MGVRVRTQNFGRLVTAGLKIYVYPMMDHEGNVITAENITMPPETKVRGLRCVFLTRNFHCKTFVGRLWVIQQLQQVTLETT